MPRNGRLAVPSPRPTTLNRRLDAYILAAAAAGAGLLVGEPTEASVVYTHANVAFSNNQNCSLDLNGDGVADFVLRDVVFNKSSGHDITLSVRGMTAGNSVMGFKSEDGFFEVAVARNQGAKIAFGTGLSSAMLARFSSSCGGIHFVFGRWVDVQNKYLALKFVINGETHFGWARLSVHVNSEFLNAFLTGYAYESVPGKAILAGQTTDTVAENGAAGELGNPEDVTPSDGGNLGGMGGGETGSRPPAVLGLLAWGAPGLSIWRRD